MSIYLNGGKKWFEYGCTMMHHKHIMIHQNLWLLITLNSWPIYFRLKMGVYLNESNWFEHGLCSCVCVQESLTCWHFAGYMRSTSRRSDNSSSFFYRQYHTSDRWLWWHGRWSWWGWKRMRIATIKEEDRSVILSQGLWMYRYSAVVILTGGRVGGQAGGWLSAPYLRNEWTCSFQTW